MPIKRLSNQEPAFPKIGTLRKGAPKPNDKQPGKDLTYFRFDTSDPAAQADFEAAYGKTPASINVYLPYPTTDENFSVWQEEYRAGGLVHRCDGETMTVHLLPSGMYSTEPKPCPYHGKQMDRNAGCKPVGRLSVIVPELKRFAYVTVGTNSINDIMELTANLNAVVAMRGSLQGVPMVLTRRPEKISTPDGKGGRARYEKWMLYIEPDPAWVRVQLEGMRINALLPAGSKMLTDGRTITQDGEIIEDEGDGYWETEEPKQLTTNGHRPAPATIPGDALGLPDRMEDYGEPLDPNPAKVEAAQTITPGQMKRLHALGTEVYGKANWDAKRAELVQAVTKGASTSSSELTPAEAQKLITGLEAKLEPAA